MQTLQTQDEISESKRDGALIYLTSAILHLAYVERRPRACPPPSPSSESDRLSRPNFAAQMTQCSKTLTPTNAADAPHRHHEVPSRSSPVTSPTADTTYPSQPRIPRLVSHCTLLPQVDACLGPSEIARTTHDTRAQRVRSFLIRTNAHRYISTVRGCLGTHHYDGNTYSTADRIPHSGKLHPNVWVHIRRTCRSWARGGKRKAEGECRRVALPRRREAHRPHLSVLVLLSNRFSNEMVACSVHRAFCPWCADVLTTTRKCSRRLPPNFLGLGM